MKSNELHKARIEWVKTDKNGKQYTKIKGDNRNIFVHINNFQTKIASFNVGDEISFQIEEDNQGARAKSIKIIKKASQSAGRPVDMAVVHSDGPAQNSSHGLTKVSPYNFCKRADKRLNNAKLQEPLKQYHDKLNDYCYDIAFEIQWKTLTSTAANPCQADVRENAIESIKDGYKGYNKRWLMFECEDGKKQLAISPFTVKSAIANGFANLMGGCYRVNTKLDSHAACDQGQYPYGGKYKRYRVSMNKSFPGILVEDPIMEGDHYNVRLYRVTEYYCDSKVLTYQPRPREEVAARVRAEGRKNFVDAVAKKGTPGYPSTVIYHGQYYFGMENTLEGGQLGKWHYHRFYVYKDIDGMEKPVAKAARIPAYHFGSQDDMKRKVYMGSFMRLPQDRIPKDMFEDVILPSLSSAEQSELRTLYTDRGDHYRVKQNYKEDDRAGIFELFKKANYNYDPRERHEFPDENYWYEDLRNLKKGQWIYYEEFNNVITNIGKNFLFKALFLHEETVPSNNRECRKLNALCPRCSMFGMSEKEDQGGSAEQEDKMVAGFRGRFKASALLCDEKLFETPSMIRNEEYPRQMKANPDATPCSVPITENNRVVRTENVPIACWKDGNQQLRSWQALLPIQGPPKNNKRDVQGKDGEDWFECYYDRVTGQINGAKQCIHGSVNISDLVNDANGKGDDYAHKLRNFIQACEAEMTFSGTVGAENCNLDEIAAFIMLLETGFSGHGFKIGQGKAFAMGSIASSVKRVWLRNKTKEGWGNWDKIQRNEGMNFDEFLSQLETRMLGQDKSQDTLTKRINAFKSLQTKLNRIENMDGRELHYLSDPRSLREYWKKFYRNMLK